MNAVKNRSPQNKGEMKRASQDSSISSSESIINGMSSKTSAHVHELVNSLKESGKTHGKSVVINKPMTGNEKLAMIFPFVESFQKLGRQQLGDQSMPALESLMSTYLSHVSLAVENCYGKPARAARLKNTISDTLLFFHMIYTEIKQPLEQSSYLDKMSDLLAFYIDMEIKASVRGTEYIAKIGSKITTSLFLFLEKSQDHILDTILKTKFMMVRSFWELCAPIFNRVLMVPHGLELVDLTYTRYLLVFKMWKKCMERAEDRRKIMKIAENRLTPPANFAQAIKTGVLRGILPRLRKSRPDVTLFLMEAKFCIKTKTSEFFKAIGHPKNRNNSLPIHLDKGLFFEEEKGGDNTEEQDDDGLMTNIWSSLNSNMSAKEKIRMANVAKLTKKKKSLKEIKLQNRKMKEQLKQYSQLENLKKRKQKCESVSSTIKEEVISDDDDVIIIEDPKVVIDLEAEPKPPENEKEMEVEVAEKIEETPQKEEPKQAENGDLNVQAPQETEKPKEVENYEFLKGIENSIEDKRAEPMEFDFPNENPDILKLNPVQEYAKGVEEFDFLSTVEQTIDDYDFNSVNNTFMRPEPLNLGKPRKFPTAAELKELPDTENRLPRPVISPPSYDFDSNELKGAYGPMESIVPLVTPAMRKENAAYNTNPLVFPNLDDDRDDRYCVNSNFNADLLYQESQYYHPPDSGFDFQPTSELSDFNQHITQDTTDPLNLTEEDIQVSSTSKTKGRCKSKKGPKSTTKKDKKPKESSSPGRRCQMKDKNFESDNLAFKTDLNEFDSFFSSFEQF